MPIIGLPREEKDPVRIGPSRQYMITRSVSYLRECPAYPEPIWTAAAIPRLRERRRLHLEPRLPCHPKALSPLRSASALQDVKPSHDRLGPPSHQTEYQTHIRLNQTKNDAKNAHFPSGTHRNRPRNFTLHWSTRLGKTNQNKVAQIAKWDGAMVATQWPERGSVIRSNIRALRPFPSFGGQPPNACQSMNHAMAL